MHCRYETSGEVEEELMGAICQGILLTFLQGGKQEIKLDGFLKSSRAPLEEPDWAMEETQTTTPESLL